MATNEEILLIVTKTDGRIGAVEQRLARVEEHLEAVNGHVKDNCKELAVLKDWRRSQGEPGLKQAVDNRVEIAKLAMQVTTTIGMITILLKVLGIL